MEKRFENSFSWKVPDVVRTFFLYRFKDAVAGIKEKRSDH